MEPTYDFEIRVRGRQVIQITQKELVALAREIVGGVTQRSMVPDGEMLETAVEDFIEGVAWEWISEKFDPLYIDYSTFDVDDIGESFRLFSQELRRLVTNVPPPEIVGQRTIFGDVVVWPDGTLASELRQ